MKLRIPSFRSRKAIIISVAALLVAGAATAVVAYATNKPAAPVSQAKPNAGAEAKTSLSASPSTSPGTTPKPSSAPVAKSGPAATSAAKPHPNFVATTTTTPLSIRKASASVDTIACSPTEITVNFYTIMVSMAQSVGGTAVAYIEFPDGTRTANLPIPVPAMAPVSAKELPAAERDVTYTVDYSTTAQDIVYRVHVTSPNAYTSPWLPAFNAYKCPDLNLPGSW